MKASMKAAMCGILTALAVVFMLLVPVVPVMLYASPVLSGMCVAIVIEELSVRDACGVYAASSVLSVLLVGDKEAVSVFILLAGAYPIIKHITDNSRSRLLKRRAARAAAKLLYINTACFAYYGAAVFMLGIPRDSFGGKTMTVFLLIFANAVMLCYDKAIERVVTIYRLKLRKYLTKGKL